MNVDRKPLPRFWYFPRSEKAVVVMTGDDHARWRHRRTLRSAQGIEPERLLGRRLGVPAQHLLHLSGLAAHQFPGGRLRSRRVRGRSARDHGLQRLHTAVARGELHRSAPAVRRRVPGASAPDHQPHPLHRLERLGLASRSPSSTTASASTPTTTTGRRAGSTTRRGCSPARGCRCASPTPTAR